MRNTFLALTVHLLIGIYWMFGMLCAPSSTTIGAENSDLYPHLWGYWRWIRKMEHGGILETWSNAEPYLYAPNPGELYHVDWLNAALVWFGTVLGLPFIGAVNGMIVLQWLLLGLGAITCCRLLRLPLWSSILVLLSIDTAPFLQRFILHSAVYERLNIGFMLFYIASLIAIHRNAHWSWTIVGILAFSLTILGSWHYALFLLLISIGIGIWILWNDPKHWRTLLALAVGCGAMAYPIAQRARSSLSSESIIEHKSTLLWDWHTPIKALNDFGVSDLVSPRIQVSYGFDVLEETIFIGWIFPILWFVCFFWNTKLLKDRFPTEDSPLKWNGLTALFWALSLYFLLLTLGPSIQVFENTSIDSPLYYLTAASIPYFSTMEVPWEYSIMAVICAAFYTGLLLQYHSRHSWFCAGLILLQNLSTMPREIGTTKITAHAETVYNQITLSDLDLREQEVLFDFPLHNHANSLPTRQAPHHEYLWDQTLHQHPIPYGIQQTWLHQSPLWRHLDEVSTQGGSWKQLQQTCNLPECRSPQQLRKTLYSQGVRYFVLHPQFTAPEHQENFETFWQRILGEPLFKDNERILFKIQSSP